MSLKSRIEAIESELEAIKLIEKNRGEKVAHQISFTRGELDVLRFALSKYIILESREMKDESFEKLSSAMDKIDLLLYGR